MSAHIVSTRTVNLIVSWAQNHLKGTVHIPASKAWNAKKPDPHGFISFDFSKADDCQLVAQMLLDENYRSVNARYREEESPEKIQFVLNRETIHGTSSIKVIKCCDCLDYQSCETDDWKETIASKMLTRIREAAVMKILRINGYEDAPWGL